MMERNGSSLSYHGSSRSMASKASAKSLNGDDDGGSDDSSMAGSDDSSVYSDIGSDGNLEDDLDTMLDFCGKL